MNVTASTFDLIDRSNQGISELLITSLTKDASTRSSLKQSEQISSQGDHRCPEEAKVLAQVHHTYKKPRRIRACIFILIAIFSVPIEMN